MKATSGVEMTKSPFIKGPRQRRAIEVLLEQESVKVREIGDVIGALNPRQIIMELRQQGFENMIFTRRYTTFDQDGKLCRPGEYYIPSPLKPYVYGIYNEFLAGGTAKVIKYREQIHVNRGI